MKKILILLVVATIGSAFVYFNGEKSSNTQQSSKMEVEDGVYKVKTEKSVLKWIGFKLTESHNGTLSFSNGTIEVKDHKIVGGEFVIDMETIKVLDIPEGKWNKKLVNHLKNGDFFEVDKYKTASFKINKFENGIVDGVLTIKGISKPLKFDASIVSFEKGIIGSDHKIIFTAKKVMFDRTDYGVKYKSKKFFDSLKDKFIKDEIQVSFEIVAVK
ncbi:MAG: YceI family protein [Flavobacteriaceae bacterium]|nr:YceI family protein [Flavobacteriaceae bacterium]